MSQSPNTRLGALPPHSTETFASRFAAAAMITMPVSVEPVNEILSTPGCATSAAPVASPRPCSRLMTPGSSPGRSSQRCRNAAVDAGVSSDDLTTTVQPAASAAPSLRTVRSTGSFHGMISAADADRLRDREVEQVRGRGAGDVAVQQARRAGEEPQLVDGADQLADA